MKFCKPIDLFDSVGLEDFSSEIFVRKADLVMKDTLKLRIKERILKRRHIYEERLQTIH